MGDKNHKYEECCAKLFLEEIFPDRYKDLVLSDKPDLQGDGVGIEVTTLCNEEIQEAVGNWINAYNTKDEQRKDRSVERMAQLGIEYTGGIQVWPALVLTVEMLKKTIIEKKKKSKNYAHFPRYELFIFTPASCDQDSIVEIKECLLDGRDDFLFKTIYVFSQNYDLHIFETDSKVYKHMLIDDIKQNERNRRAWKIVNDSV